MSASNASESSFTVCWLPPAFGHPEGYILSYIPTGRQNSAGENFLNLTMEQLHKKVRSSNCGEFFIWGIWKPCMLYIHNGFTCIDMLFLFIFSLGIIISSSYYSNGGSCQGMVIKNWLQGVTVWLLPTVTVLWWVTWWGGQSTGWLCGRGQVLKYLSPQSLSPFLPWETVSTNTTCLWLLLVLNLLPLAFCKSSSMIYVKVNKDSKFSFAYSLLFYRLCRTCVQSWEL